MKRHPLWSAILGGLLLLTTCGPAAEPAAPPAVEALSVANAWQRRIPRFEFDNLPLAEVVKELRRQFPEVNFIVPDSTADASVRLVLRSVTLGDILKAMELASEGHLRGAIVGAEDVPAVTGALAVRPANTPSNLVSFTFTPIPPEAPPPANPATCRAFSLAGYLAGKTEVEAETAIKSLYEAIEVSWRMLSKFDRDIQTPSFTIHHGTKLLIVVGREKEMAVIEQITRELPGAGPATMLTPQAKNDFKSKPPPLGLPPVTGARP